MEDVGGDLASERGIGDEGRNLFDWTEQAIQVNLQSFTTATILPKCHQIAICLIAGVSAGCFGCAFIFSPAWR